MALRIILVLLVVAWASLIYAERCIEFKNIKTNFAPEYFKKFEFKPIKMGKMSYKQIFSADIIKAIPGSHQVKAAATVNGMNTPMNFNYKVKDCVTDKLFYPSLMACSNLKSDLPIQPGLYEGKNCSVNFEGLSDKLPKKASAVVQLLDEKKKEILSGSGEYEMKDC